MELVDVDVHVGGTRSGGAEENEPSERTVSQSAFHTPALGTGPMDRRNERVAGSAECTSRKNANGRTRDEKVRNPYQPRRKNTHDKRRGTTSLAKTRKCRRARHRTQGVDREILTSTRVRAANFPHADSN